MSHARISAFILFVAGLLAMGLAVAGCESKTEPTGKPGEKATGDKEKTETQIAEKPPADLSVKPDVEPPIDARETSEPFPARKRPKRSDFFGLAVPAGKSVFVIDASGSMTDSIMYAKYELKSCLNQLAAEDSFDVIFFSQGPPLEMPGGGLVAATEANRKAAADFIDGIVPIGNRGLDEALTRAFELEPDAVYLLTDGSVNKETVALVARLNAARKVVVNTCAFIYSGGEAGLMQIAQQNGGDYKYIGEDDLDSLGR